MNYKLLAFTFFTCFLGRLNAQTVNTQFGPIQGSQVGSTYQFLGIPFAKPPVGPLRWTAPQTPNSWTSTLNTTAFAPVCPQKHFDQGDTVGTVIGNEDCLYLNVWTPQTGASNKAVMVFIHGGGNQQGGTSEVSGGTTLYNGKNLSERGDVVVVTIQYRLGALGFLAHPGLNAENTSNLSGNYAVMDQILALQWVQNNIAAFGGDPNNVMIFGESAGGVNVGNLLFATNTTGLFHKACIQSASPVIKNFNTGLSEGQTWVNQFVSTGTDVQKITALRALTADSLLHFETSPLEGGMVQMNWQPVVDGQLFTNYPIPLVQSGNYNKVPLMIGSNSEEMSLSAPPTVTPGMVTLLRTMTVPSALQSTAASLYPSGSDNTQARISYVNLLTDMQFTATTRRVARCVSQNQNEPVFRYFFTFKHTIPQLQPFGSYHGMELFYVFNNWENATLGSGMLFKPADDSTQQNILSYWTNFAKTGNPNGTGLVNWPVYQSATDCYLEIKASPYGSNCGLRTAQSNLWDNAVNFSGCTSSLGIDENEAQAIIIYPNPTNKEITIEMETPDKVVVWSTTGIRMAETSSSNFHIIETESWAPGIYLVKTNGKTLRFVKR